MIAIADTINYAVSIADCKQNNEASEVRFLRSGTPKSPHGLSPLSSNSLYLKTQSSTPCAILANSFDLTFFSRYPMISGDNVTVKDFFLILSIQESFLWKLIYTFINHSCLTRIIRVGVPKNESNRPISERADRHAGEFEIVQRCKSRRQNSQYSMQNIMGMLVSLGRSHTGEHREQDNGSHARDLGNALNEVFNLKAYKPITSLFFHKEANLVESTPNAAVIGSSVAVGLRGFKSHTDEKNTAIIHTHITHTHSKIKTAMNFCLIFSLPSKANGGLCALFCALCFALGLPYARD